MLKKFSYILAVILTLACVGYVNTKPLFSNYSDSFTVYVGSNSSNAQILTVDSKDYRFIKDVTGESVKISNLGFDVNEFFEKYNAKICAYIFKNMKKAFRKIDRVDRVYQRQLRKQKSGGEECRT